MTFQSIRVEGTLFSAELLAKLDDGFKGQAPKDFGLGPRERVRDRIMETWGDLSEQWKVFRRRRERLAAEDTGTTETRRFWMEPFFAALGFELELRKAGEPIAGRSYPISHRDAARAGLPVHIAGCGTSLDQKPGRGGLSPHALVQEYLNLSDAHLFSLVTNGIVLRLVRDCGRISRLSYVEFDLERMFEGDLYADFAILFRFVHATRFASDPEDPAACIIEDYHQESVAEGGRIQAQLSMAVEDAIRSLGNGFLADDHNAGLREAAASGALKVGDYYHELLLLVYRLLFLMVIEERVIIFGPDADPAKASVYDRFYSLRRLRGLSSTILADLDRHGDWYRLLLEIFALFDEKGSGAALGISPLGGDLFRSTALPHLSGARLSNRALKEALARLDSFTDTKSGQPVRVNYASLNVEEFGSVYEGLLELQPVFTPGSGRPGFGFAQGSTRGDTGSHYTPDELVQKLVKAGVEPAIDEALSRVKSRGLGGKDYAREAEKALLSLRILDSACGSGHMLLGAARRIGLELARARHDEDQPSPSHLRQGVRDAISHCVYGVDFNPLAVELCKVALWLEGHEPGKPLGFLDHRIRCGDSLVGVERLSVLEEPLPDDAFDAKPGDDKKVCAALKKNNKREREEAEVGQALMDFGNDDVERFFRAAGAAFSKVEAAGDGSVDAVEAKRTAFQVYQGSGERSRLELAAHLRLAPRFSAWDEEAQHRAVTEAGYRAILKGQTDGARHAGAAAALAASEKRRFFHWFLEFPTVFPGKAEDGFDVIIGNPPFLGGKKISGTYGADYLDYLTATNPPAGAMDLVGFFFRRNYSLLNNSGRMALIATKTIAEGETREGSLDYLVKRGTIYWAYKSIPWPGKAAVSVSLIAIKSGKMNGPFQLNGKTSDHITPFLDGANTIGNPEKLAENSGKSFIGSIVLGTGFVLDPEKASLLIKNDIRNKEVLFPYLTGEDLNTRPDCSPSRWVINFSDMPLRRRDNTIKNRPEDEWESVPSDYQDHVAEDYPVCLEIVEKLVKPERIKNHSGKNLDISKKYVRYWWQFGVNVKKLYITIKGMDRVLGIARVSRTGAFTFYRLPVITSDVVVTFAYNGSEYFSLLQSTSHFIWSYKYCSTMKGDLRYSPVDAFQTFPFPDCLRPGHPVDAIEENLRAELDEAGGDYYKERAELMRLLNLGLTKTYNLFHDPVLDEARLAAVLAKSGGSGGAADMLLRIKRLRELHAAMDTVVLRAYGWSDLEPGHGFHELDFLPENDRVRFTICEEARRTVLERLLELNWRRKREEGGTVRV